MDIVGLIPTFGGLIWTIAAFIIALSVIIAIHEYGHYIVGRWTGIEADVFSLGFGPVLFSRVDKHGTKWQFALLPFGGYVKFKGDANAASGKDEEAMEGIATQSPEELRRTMHGAPLWARAATVAAGPVFNFAMSILVFGLIFWSQGVSKEPLTVVPSWYTLALDEVCCGFARSHIPVVAVSVPAKLVPHPPAVSKSSTRMTVKSGSFVNQFNVPE